MQLDDLYRHFERVVAGVLMAGMVVVIALATWSFLREAGLAAADPTAALDYPVFQTLFDRLLAAIIALELAHSVQLMVSGRRGLTQLRAVLAIGVLAVVRKLVLIDIGSVSPLLLIGLSAAILALAGALALLSWVQHTANVERLPSPGAEE
ncbi:phosphate-starvation-inducible PsiE family protein [Rhodosalinus sp.]|uniref:phosphate-starvation-inducible PsiE family protein n=2 Tax=Rhodosalinus sp. TaxID=2047741 RepID=UPI0035685065